MTKHDADANDNIHDCVALHDANTNDHSPEDFFLRLAFRPASKVKEASFWIQTSRLPGMEGRGRCRISLYAGASVIAPQIIAIGGNEHPQVWIRYHPVGDRNRGTRLKNQWSPLSEIFTVSHWQDCCGKDYSKKLGKVPTWQKITNFLVRKCGRQQHGWKEAQFGTYVGNSTKRDRFGGSNP